MPGSFSWVCIPRGTVAKTKGQRAQRGCTAKAGPAGAWGCPGPRERAREGCGSSYHTPGRGPVRRGGAWLETRTTGAVSRAGRHHHASRSGWPREGALLPESRQVKSPQTHDPKPPRHLWAPVPRTDPGVPSPPPAPATPRADPLPAGAEPCLRRRSPAWGGGALPSPERNASNCGRQGKWHHLSQLDMIIKRLSFKLEVAKSSLNWVYWIGLTRSAAERKWQLVRGKWVFTPWWLPSGSDFLHTCAHTHALTQSHIWTFQSHFGIPMCSINQKAVKRLPGGLRNKRCAKKQPSSRGEEWK